MLLESGPFCSVISLMKAASDELYSMVVSVGLSKLLVFVVISSSSGSRSVRSK